MPDRMNRSPCHRAALSARLDPRPRLLQEAAGTARRARAGQPPRSVLTPERARAKGVHAQQTTEHVALHEDIPVLANAVLKEDTRDGQPVTVVKADVAICDIINRNGRFYPRSAYEAANAAAKADLDAGKVWGLMDHPSWWEPYKGSLGKIAARWETLDIEDDREIPDGQGGTRKVAMVVATGVIVPTGVGQDLEALLKGRVAVGISTNAWASTLWKAAREVDPTHYDPDELIPVVQDDLRYLTIDFVSDPSNVGGLATTEDVEDAEDPAPTPTPVPPPTPAAAPGTAHTPKETPMKIHPLMKALSEKHGGKTPEQLKKDHATEYYAVLEQIAEAAAEPVTPATEGAGAAPATPTVTPPVTPPSTTPTPEQFRTLQDTTVKQEGRIAQLEQDLTHSRRDGLVREALLAANLPKVGVRGEGEGAVDMDAAFSDTLLQDARAAKTDEDARALITARIEDRRFMTRHLATQEGAKQGEARTEHLNRDGKGGVTLPTAQDAQRAQEGSASVMEAVGFLGL